MKDIITGNSSFEVLINGGYLYVDKTKYLYELIKNTGTYYFLSRPRRFGKSLTLSTLEAIFKGKRELFKDLYIDSTNYDWKEYPVIHLDFSTCIGDSSSDISDWINRKIIDIGISYGVKLSEEAKYNYNLDKLITELAKREKVVVLIDEYDSILSNNINSENLEEIRSTLRGFYSVLKAQAANIRMCFITGVTKFSKVSIFSAMNNLTDISMNENYATMLGYTQKELEQYFATYIDRAVISRETTREKLLEDIKTWYDGYCFAPKAETVYNPVSVGFFFYENSEFFNPYWIDTGGTSFLLTEIAKQVHFDISLDANALISWSSLRGADIVQMLRTEVSKENFLALLYQTGYLTIKEASKGRSGYLVTLGYPNEEVKQGLNEILLPSYVGSAAKSFDKLVIVNCFDTGNVAKAMEIISSIFASIPYYELVFDSESAWHAGFVCMLNMLEADIIPEQSTNKGRIDCVLRCPKDIYIIEFKFNQSAEVAIEQIKNNGYCEQYLTSEKKIHLLGINFSTEQKNIVEWKEEIL